MSAAGEQYYQHPATEAVYYEQQPSAEDAEVAAVTEQAALAMQPSVPVSTYYTGYDGAVYQWSAA